MSTIPVGDILAARAASPPTEAFSVLPALRAFVLWSPVLFFSLLAIGYITSTLNYIPIVKPQSRLGWLKGLMYEPKAPEVAEYIRTTANKGLVRFRGVLGTQRVLVTSNAGFHEVLQEKSYIFNKWDSTKRVLGPLMGNGLLLTEGDIHKSQKRQLGPSFAPRHIKELHPIFLRKAAELSSTLAKKAGNGEIVNLSVWASRATFDIISVTIFGMDTEMLKNPKSPVSTAYGKLFSPDDANGTSNIRSTLGVVLPLKLLQALPLKRNETIARENRTIRDFCRECIAKERALLKEGKNLQSLNVISVALKDGNVDTEELVDQLMTILVAGHETVSHALSWGFHQLAQAPEVQNKLRAEVRANIPSLDAEEAIETADVTKLPYLHAVCEEILRLNPVIPILYRQASETTTILGEPIPKDTVVALSPWAINRDKQRWGEDADVFRPERWLEEESNPTKLGKNSKYTFSSFSHGPRQCLGVSFARVKFMALVAGMIGKFQVEYGGREPSKNFGLVTLKPGGGVTVRLRQLEGW